MIIIGRAAVAFAAESPDPRARPAIRSASLTGEHRS
jgi:hypothetical protein